MNAGAPARWMLAKYSQEGPDLARTTVHAGTVIVTDAGAPLSVPPRVLAGARDTVEDGDGVFARGAVAA